METQAIERILRDVRKGHLYWVSSEVLENELASNPDLERRLKTEILLELAHGSIAIDFAIEQRAVHLSAAGYGAFDALHLACAEAARASVLLTTDDGFLSRANRGVGKPTTEVANPLFWGRGVLLQ